MAFIATISHCFLCKWPSLPLEQPLFFTFSTQKPNLSYYSIYLGHLEYTINSMLPPCLALLVQIKKWVTFQVQVQCSQVRLPKIDILVFNSSPKMSFMIEGCLFKKSHIHGDAEFLWGGRLTLVAFFVSRDSRKMHSSYLRSNFPLFWDGICTKAQQPKTF